MPLPIVLYGAADCEDTERTRHFLQTHAIPFQEIDVDQDTDAERFVIIVNKGFRSTPTLVLGEGKCKIVLTEPDQAQLAYVLSQAEFWIQEVLTKGG